jgi:cytochrome c5
MTATTRFERRWISVALLACMPVVMHGAQAQSAERAGKEVVGIRCAQCHESGASGAPKIGDKQAWTPRLKHGIDVTVHSAIKGHGSMPARGGMPDLTDAEVRSAILYMFNPAPAPVADAPAAKPVKAQSNHVSVAGMEVFFGLASAKTLRAFPKDSLERTMHGGVPAGDSYQHVNVSLFASANNAPISDAKVELQIEQPGLGSESKTLEPMSAGSSSYGGYFKMSAHTPYRFTVRVQRPGSSQPTQAVFERRP